MVCLGPFSPINHGKNQSDDRQIQITYPGLQIGKIQVHDFVYNNEDGLRLT